MTLLITVITKDTIFQAADHQLTISSPAGVRVVSTSSVKIVTFSDEGWDGFIVYTGVGRVGATDTSKTVLSWLAGLTGDPASVAERIRDRGGPWLQRLGPHLHTFLLVVTSINGAEVFKISNFEDLHGRCDNKPAATLSIDRRRMREGIVICGQKDSVAKPASLTIRAEMKGAAADSGRMRRLLRRVNAQASRSNHTVSPTCDVFSMRRDGHGHFDYEGAETALGIMHGVVMPDLAALLRQIGFSGAVVSGVSSRSGPRIPYRACSPSIIAPQEGSGYALEEIGAFGDVSARATHVNESGTIVGTRAPPGQVQAPWELRPTSTIRECPAAGNTAGVTARGTVVLTVQMNDNSEQAALWDASGIVLLGTHKGRSSGATATASDFVVGWVCIDPVDQGQRNFRPAAWRGGQIQVWEEPPFTWGQCVDVRQDGTALVLGYHDHRPGAYLWDLNTGIYSLVGSGLGVFPMALSTDGKVFGTVQTPGGSMAYVATATTSWQTVGLPAGYYATCINDQGKIAGAAVVDGYERPWIYDGANVRWLPFFRDHWCRPVSMSDNGLLVGAATTDHGSHALIWRPTD